MTIYVFFGTFLKFKFHKNLLVILANLKNIIKINKKIKK